VAAGTAVPVLALDVPTGLSADGAQVDGPRVEATATISFFAPKVGLVSSTAAAAVGELFVAPLGVPPRAVAEVVPPVELLSAGELRLPQRPAEAHKGTFGHVLIVAGARGKSGAAALAARGALRSGAGLVTVATPDSCLSEVATGCVEAMTAGLEVDADGRPGAPALEQVRELLAGKDVLAVGPGLGGGDETGAWIRSLVCEAAVPTVVDADGLNAFAGRLAELRGRSAPLLLTPHPGEMARLLDRATPRTDEERRRAARDAAVAAEAVVVLKGSRTLVATPGGELWTNPSGNSGMATAGSGDVLTGTCAALVAGGLDMASAACSAVYLHGLAGDIGAGEIGEAGLVAGDVAERLPRALRVAGTAAGLRHRSFYPVDRAEIRLLVHEASGGRGGP
ncbi:MAG: NAD(P)H-hydrate dehydratase, partial [Thermoanaerobaculia bacterium]|nr:NAD(P)H-hydrate dehydratase [Thermoanaerobaculia bacterium]